MTTTTELKEKAQTILVVDDTSANLSIVADQLEIHGFHVVVAQDGAEGVQRALLVHPDLILLDVMMPGIDGFETCRRLKAEEKTKDIPIIFMTSLTQLENKMTGFEVGGVDYITKPFQLDEMLARVKTHLALHTLQQRLEAQNWQLQEEVVERKRVEEELRTYKEHLEEEVAKRTVELTETNAQLQREIVEHRQTEEELAHQRASLADLYAKEQASRKLAEQLQASAQVVNSSLDLNVVLPSILDQLHEVIDCDGASLQLLEDDAMRVLAVHGYSASEIGQVRRLADFPYNHRLASNPEPIILEETLKAELWSQSPEYSAIRSNIGVPLIVRDQIIGALTIDSHQPDRYTPQDAQAALAFARQAAIAIENARLYTSAQKVLDERIRAEEALRASEERYRALYENIPSMYFTVDPVGTVVSVNQFGAAELGYTSEELIGQSVLRVFPDKYQAAATAHVAECLANPAKVFHWELCKVRKDGSLIWVKETARAVQNREGNLAVLIVCEDITERKQAEEALRESEERFRYMTLATRDAIYDWDIQTNSVWRNEAYQALYSPNEPIGTDASWWEKHIHPNDRQRVLESIKKAFHGQKPSWSTEYRFQRYDSDYATVIDRGYVLYDQDTPVRMIGAMTDITERKQAEEALRESEERYRSLFQHSPLSLWEEDFSEVKKHIDSLRASGVKDLRSYFQEHPEEVVHCAKLVKVLQVNKATVRFVEADREEDLLEGLGKIFTEETFKAFQEEILALAQGRLIFETEGRGITLRGRRIAYALILSISPGYEETWSKVLVSIIDLTARKRAEHFQAVQNDVARVLAESPTLSEAAPQLLKSICENLGWEIGELWTVDRITNLLRCVESWHIPTLAAPKFIAYSRQNHFALGIGLPGLVWKSGQPMWISDVATSSNFLRAKIADQEGLHGALGFPLWLGNDIMGVIGLFSRETRQSDDDLLEILSAIGSQIGQFIERKRVGAALRENQALLQSIINNTSAVIYVKDTQGRYLLVNRRFEELFHISNDEIAGKTDYNLFPKEQADVFRANDMNALTAGTPVESEEIVPQNGEQHIYISIKCPLFDKTRRAYAVCGISTDITERRHAEEALRESEAQLRQSQKMEAVGRLAGGIAHDFNNMLLPIIGYSDMLLTRMHQNDPLRHQIGEIKKAGERAASLTRQILAFSRKQVLQPHVLDLNLVMTDMEKMLQRLIGEDVELVTRLHSDLWPVKVDPSQIEQVILNLAVNARDAMPEGGNLIIETTNVLLDEEYSKNHVTVRPGPYVMLAVSDTGCGMDANTQSRIFEPFFTTKERGKGTGLGLSTVYGIVKQSGGNIWVYSEVGRGTTFKIYLPRVEEEAEALEPALLYDEVQGGSETILVVEDEEGVRQALQDILEAGGYHVLLTTNGNEALELCALYGDPIHLLITDVVLPQMGGREVAERLATVYPEMKVLFISGYTENSVVHNGVLEARVPFLQKPFTASALLQKIREVL